MDKCCIVDTSVANLYNNPSFTSELVTQALFWEQLLICNKKDSWVQVKQSDGYIAWIHSFYITDSSTYENNKILHKKENWYFVKERVLEIKINNIKKYLLPFGSIIPCINQDDDSVLILPNGEQTTIDIKKLIHYSNSMTLDKILELSEPLLGIPYVWGGKSSFGFDCSGFIQMVFKVAGISVKRDANQQVGAKKLKKISMCEAEAGDLVFFSENDWINHVALVVGNGKIIHSSGEVKLESIIKGEIGFNPKLAQLEHSYMSIRGMLNS